MQYTTEDVYNKVTTNGFFVYENFTTNILNIDREFEKIINDNNNFDNNTGKNRY